MKYSWKKMFVTPVVICFVFIIKNKLNILISIRFEYQNKLLNLFIDKQPYSFVNPGFSELNLVW